MNISISKLFHQILVNSLNTQQVNYLGELYERTFNLHKVAGFSPSIPIPRQTAADILVSHFQNDDDIVRLFSILLSRDGQYFHNRELHLWGRDEFIRLLERNKWIFDSDLNLFFVDPFYEHEINFLKDVRVIDLREKIQVAELTKKFAAISRTMQVQDLDWRITLRLYDLEPKSAELVRKIIDLLLARQNLQSFAGEVFFCLKELAINASKANYKLLFRKQLLKTGRIDSGTDYNTFLEMFRQEIEDNGNSQLFKLAKQEDKCIVIVFQSSGDSLELWVVNSQNISMIEKQKILKIVAPERLSRDAFINDDDYTEGAGLGLTIILNVLKKISAEAEPLKVIFYPDYIKIGFKLDRAELLAQLKEKERTN